MEGLFWGDLVGLCFAFGSYIAMVVVPSLEFAHVEL